jgi:hypothetical protein
MTSKQKARPDPGHADYALPDPLTTVQAEGAIKGSELNFLLAGESGIWRLFRKITSDPFMAGSFGSFILRMHRFAGA